MLLSSCATSRPENFQPPGRTARIDSVPFHSLTAGNCGPASLASVLNHLGDPVSAQEVSAAIMRPDYRGSTTLDLLLYPRSRGFSSRWTKSTVDELMSRIDAGISPIVMIDQGIGPISKNHFMAVIGYSPQGILISADSPDHELMTWEHFLPQWQRTANWMLIVESKEGRP